MQEFEEALEGHALLNIGPRGPEKCKLILLYCIMSISIAHL